MTREISLSQDQAEWLAQQLDPGTDYVQIGSQFIFSLTDAEWEHWLPKLPSPAVPPTPMKTYGDIDGWTFQFDGAGKPIPGQFSFTRFVMNGQAEPCVEYNSGGFKGTRGFLGKTADEVRAMLLALGFEEKTTPS